MPINVTSFYVWLPFLTPNKHENVTLSFSLPNFAKISFSLPFVSSLPTNPIRETSLIIAVMYIKWIYNAI